MVAVLEWPGFTSAWARLAPHDRETVTGAHQVGVAFSAHTDVAYRAGARRGRASYGGGAVICSGADPIVWSDVRDPTDALEVYPSPGLVASMSGRSAESGWPVERALIGVADPVVVAVAGVLRRAHAASAYLGETASSGLGQLLARHLLTEYGDVRPSRPPDRARLTSGQVRRVADLVADDLSGSLTLDRLAAEVHLSPHHFARAFRATTGLPPHAYVTARRMDRARDLLATTPTTVAQVAAAVGFGNLSHFRRVFRAHAGAGPSAFRSEPVRPPVSGRPAPGPA